MVILYLLEFINLINQPVGRECAGFTPTPTLHAVGYILEIQSLTNGLIIRII